MLQGFAKQFAKGNFRVVTLTGREGAADRIRRVHRLYETVLSRSQVQFECLPAEYFREIWPADCPTTPPSLRLSRRRSCRLFRLDVQRKTSHGVMLGIDYESNREYDLYFNVLFKSLDVAFRRGAHDIELGQTSDTTKHGKLDIYQGPLSLYVKGGRSTARRRLEIQLPLLFPPRPISYQREDDDNEE